MTSKTSITVADWQQQAYQSLVNKDYKKAAQLYERAVEIEPEIKSHYWNLGLMLLLQEQEVEAQTVWLLGMAEGGSDEIDTWTVDLVQVLETEAERQRWQVGDYKIAWVIRQHIREIQPENINNLLHLIGLSILRKTYTAENLSELAIIEILNTQELGRVNSELILQVLKSVFEKPPEPIYYELTKASIFHIENTQTLISILIPKIYQIAYIFRSYHLALKFVELGLEISPNHPELLKCLASFYQDIHEYKKGIEAAKRCYNAMESEADKVYAHFLLIRGLMGTGGKWDEVSIELKQYKSLLNNLCKQQPKDLPISSAVSLFATPFFFPYFQDEIKENLKIRSEITTIAQVNVENNLSETIQKCRYWQSRALSYYNHSKPLKIGYLSHCFRNHSVGWLARWIFKYHDREKFKIYGYFLAAEAQPSNLQRWYLTQVDKAHQLPLESVETAEKICEDQIDILIDLDSITLTNSCEIMVIKPAPVQVTWLGWDASSVPSVDYYIADPYVLPESAQEYYTEKIWRLPQTYIAVDGFETNVPTLRLDKLNIPSDAVIYFSGQKGYKYNPNTVRLQMKIMREVSNSYFLLKGVGDQELLKNFFIQIATEEGVIAERLRFLPTVRSEQEHRANLGIVDVVLDTYPYNGATTTMETLWMGIPMVTRVGQQFASRNSYTMMMNAGITEGIAWTDEEYVEWGIRLGTDEALRQQISWKLRKSRQTAPLWNAEQFTREMENAYQQMWRIYLDGKY